MCGRCGPRHGRRLRVLGALSTALLLVLATVAGFSPLAVAATCSGAVVAVGSAEIAPGVSGGVPITVSQLPSACPSLAGWQISIGYNPAVLSVTGVTGSSQWSSVTANTGTAGTVLLTASQQAGVTGTQVLGTLEFKAVGSAGSSSALTPSAVTLTDPQLEAIGASTSPGSVQIVGGAEAQLAVTPHVSQGGAAGLSATVPAVVYAGSNRTVQGEDVAGYQLNVAASDPTAVRLGAAVCSTAFSGCAARVDQNAGTETVAAAAYQGVAPPTDLAFLPVRLTGPVTEAVQITTTLQNVVDQQGSTLLPPSPVTVTLQRGAVYVACDSGGNPVAGARGLTVADAVAALQYLVRLRQAGAGCGQVNPAALASLVPVGSGQGSQTSVADVVALLQYLVGLRNAQMEMASAGSSGSSTTGTSTTASGGGGGNGGAKPSTAQITAFSVTPSELASSGGTAQLSWTTSNATTCSLTSSPVISGLSQAQVCGSGQITQSLPSNSGTAPAIYTFTLSVSNGNGQTATATATVTVAPASTQTQRASTSLSLNLVNCLEGNAVSASGYTGNGWVAHAGDTVTLGACVSSHGDPLQGIPVVFTVNGHQMEGTTDANGNAYVQLSLSGWPVGTYPITASFTGDSAYQPSSGGNWLTVNPETAAATSLSVTDATGQAGGTATLQATLTANGSPVADQTVTFTVNGQQLPATTDSSGTASATLSLSGVAAGSYTINGSFAGSSAEQASSGTGTLTVTATATSAAATNLNVWGAVPESGQPAQLDAALSNAAGNVIGGEPVTFHVNGQQVTATTASDGLATTTIDVSGWASGNYPLTATFAGSSAYQPSAGSSVLTVGTASTNGSGGAAQPTELQIGTMSASGCCSATFPATLTADGAPLAGETVTFSFNGQTITGTTDSQGVASATLSLSGLQAGSYPLSASFAGTSSDQASTASVSITVSGASSGTTSAQVQTLLADLPGLPSGMAKAVQAAAGSLSSTQLQQLLSQVAALSSAQQQHLATVLGTAWPNLSSAQQQALVDTLLGVPTTADQQALAQAASSEWQALQQDLVGLAPTLVNVAEEFSAQYGIAANAQDSSALAQFFDTLLGTLVPHVEALLQTALEREPAVQQVLDLAGLQASLQANNPFNTILMMLSVADSQSEAFIQQAAYEVGLNFLADTSYGFVVDGLSGDTPAPAAIQQDVADCIWSSTCTPAEAQVVVTWIQDSVANEQSQNTQITGLVDQMQAESEASTAGWMAAEAAG